MTSFLGLFAVEFTVWIYSSFWGRGRRFYFFVKLLQGPVDVSLSHFIAVVLLLSELFHRSLVDVGAKVAEKILVNLSDQICFFFVRQRLAQLTQLHHLFRQLSHWLRVICLGQEGCLDFFSKQLCHVDFFKERMAEYLVATTGAKTPGFIFC